MTMDLRSRERKLSFEILSDLDSTSAVPGDADHSSDSDPIPSAAGDGKANRRKRKKKKKKKMMMKNICSPVESPAMNAIAENFPVPSESIDVCSSVSEEAQLGVSCHNYISQSVSGGGGSVVVCQEIGSPEESAPSSVSHVSMGELRQRTLSTAAGASGVGTSEEEPSSSPLAISVSISWAGENAKEESSSGTLLRTDQSNGKLQTQESLDWRQLMADDPNCKSFAFLVLL